MKIRPPFIGYPSPSLAVWHLFARVGDMIDHVAFLTYDSPASFPVQRNAIPYNEEDIRRWSEFDFEKAKTAVG